MPLAVKCSLNYLQVLKTFFEFCSKVDEYGFTRSDDFNYDTYGDFMSKYLKVLATRAKKWAAFLKNDKYLSQERKLKRYIRKGIPNEHRGEVSTLYVAYTKFLTLYLQI